MDPQAVAGKVPGVQNGLGRTGAFCEVTGVLAHNGTFPALNVCGVGHESPSALVCQGTHVPAGCWGMRER